MDHNCESLGSRNLAQEDMVQIDIEELAIMCADALERDEEAIHSSFYQDILKERIAVAHRVVELLLSRAESMYRSIAPFLQEEGYDSLKKGYKFIDTAITTANQILKQIACLPTPLQGRMYDFLRMNFPKEVDIATERLWFLIRVRDWNNLFTEIEKGTLDHNQTIQEIWYEPSEYETYMNTEEFREFYEDQLIPFVVAKEDWGILIWAGFYGSRGGDQHPSIPSDVVDRAYQLGHKSYQGFLLKKFPDLAQ